MDRKQVKALFDGLSPGAREAFNEGNVYAMAPYAPELVAAGLLSPETVYRYTELGASVSDPDARPTAGELADAIEDDTNWIALDYLESYAIPENIADYRVDPEAVSRLIETCSAACIAAKDALVSAIRALPEVE